MNEQAYNCEKCRDTGMESYYIYGKGLGFGWKPCDCPVAIRQQKRHAELAQLGQELSRRCNELNTQAAELAKSS